MSTALKSILVIGGNGFIGQCLSTYKARLVDIFLIGSAVCKTALARGIQVTSVRHACVFIPEFAYRTKALQFIWITSPNGERAHASMGIQSVLSLRFFYIYSS